MKWRQPENGNILTNKLNLMAYYQNKRGCSGYNLQCAQHRVH
jgi:hypothetical protein